VVAEMTGVPEPTLRAWERRYGVPAPERTASGYRLYGPRDVEQVREMRRLCDEGVAAAEAARIVVATRGESRSDAAQSSAVGNAYDAAVEGMLRAITALDDVELEQQIRRAIYLGPSTALFDRVLAPTLVRVGQLWHDGELSIAQEHFATRRIATLVEALSRLVVDETSAHVILIACFADELHEVGAIGLALRVATWGWRPVFLGARTPAGALRSAVEAVTPKLVALSVTVAPERARARELVDSYASACGSVPWMVGGSASAAIADLVERAGGMVAPAEIPALRSVLREAAARSPGGSSKPRPSRAAKR
jgi:DNA-binding transcriptional MerR regulator